jgi:hypothetical protein
VDAMGRAVAITADYMVNETVTILGRRKEAAQVPLRAVMEFMRKNKLPYYSDTADVEKGREKITEIRSKI